MTASPELFAVVAVTLAALMGFAGLCDVLARHKTTGEEAKLPAERELAKEYGVAYTTVRHAMEIPHERALTITANGRTV